MTAHERCESLQHKQSLSKLNAWPMPAALHTPIRATRTGRPCTHLMHRPKRKQLEQRAIRSDVWCATMLTLQHVDGVCLKRPQLHSSVIAQGGRLLLCKDEESMGGARPAAMRE